MWAGKNRSSIDDAVRYGNLAAPRSNAKLSYGEYTLLVLVHHEYFAAVCVLSDLMAKRRARPAERTAVGDVANASSLISSSLPRNQPPDATRGKTSMECHSGPT
jgi:hypothetical protein